MIIETAGVRLDVDAQKTRAYYDAFSPCDCGGCGHFYKNIEQCYPALTAFLRRFGADASRPEEIIFTETADGRWEYPSVWYVVYGEMPETEEYAAELEDTSALKITARPGEIPGGQTGDAYVTIEVQGLIL